MDDKPRKQDALKFLAFLLTTSGGDITAPEPLLEQEVAQFKEVKRVSENDEAVDALVAVARTNSQQERLEIVEILSMKLLTVTQILKLQTSSKIMSRIHWSISGTIQRPETLMLRAKP